VNNPGPSKLDTCRKNEAFYNRLFLHTFWVLNNSEGNTIRLDTVLKPMNDMLQKHLNIIVK
jgi:hypothetical protein